MTTESNLFLSSGHSLPCNIIDMKLCKCVNIILRNFSPVGGQRRPGREGVDSHKFCMLKQKNLDPLGGGYAEYALDPPVNIQGNESLKMVDSNCCTFSFI